MAPEDQQLVSSATHEIRRRAAIEAIDLDQPGWSFEHLACTAFPHSLVLRYKRQDAVGALSMFSVAIARSDGEVRLVPIARRGYAQFKPAPESPMSVGALNSMLAREDPKPPIAEIAVCYAALTGAPAERDASGKLVVRAEGPPIIQVEDSGSAVAITTSSRPAQSWTLQFDRQGNLLSADSVTNSGSVEHQVPHTKQPAQAKPAPANQEPRVRPLPPLAQPQGKPVPPPSEH